jgi:hypothetical protein
VKADPHWPAPSGARFGRARIAWDMHARGIWGQSAASFESKPAWVQELWAQVADAALSGRDVLEGARLACEKRIELEDRGRLGQSWDTAMAPEHELWQEVARAVRQASG